MQTAGSDTRHEAVAAAIRIIQDEELELEQLKDPSVVELLRQAGIKIGNAVFIQHAVSDFKRI